MSATTAVHPPEIAYEQLTDLTDAAVAPAIYPDGHTVAFIRGSTSFASAGPVYVKALPNGEDKLVSNDPRPKYGLAFSPDSSRIAYAALELPVWQPTQCQSLEASPNFS